MPDKDTWEFINTFAPWLSAFGTVLAVIVSLYLAQREKRIKLSVMAGHRLMLSRGQEGKPPEYLYIRVVNKGYRTARLTNLGWSIGYLKKRAAMQTTINDGYSSRLPIDLLDGEEASYYIPIETWLKDFSENFVERNSWYVFRSLRIIAFTSVGKVFQTRIEKGLEDKIKGVLRS